MIIILLFRICSTIFGLVSLTKAGTESAVLIVGMIVVLALAEIMELLDDRL